MFERPWSHTVVLPLLLIAVSTAANAADNIVEVADKAGALKAIEAAGLAHTLQEDGPFTVFAPKDEAFAKLPKHTLNDLLKPENKEKLATILKYHVIAGKVTAKDAGRVGFAKTLSGDSVSISNRDGRLAVNDANVVLKDLEASNGIVHVIDEVLLAVHDGRESLTLANRLAEKEDWVPATDAYLSAYRCNPALYAPHHTKVFQKAGRLTEHANFFDQTMVHRMGLLNGLDSLVWACLRGQETQAAGYELLKRVFNNKSNTFSWNHTSNLLLTSSTFPWEKVPDSLYYLRCVFLPTDFEQPGWQRLSVSHIGEKQYSVSGYLKIARPLYYNREALQQFAKEIRELLEKHPKWVGGWALLAFIEAESGNSREAVDVLRKRFLDADSYELPASAAWLLGECLAGKDEELDRIVIELLEPCVREIATRTSKRALGKSGKTLRLSPIKTLARLYAKYDRRQEARQLLYGLTDSANQHPLVEGYAGNIIGGFAFGSCGNRSRCLACHHVDRGDSNFKSYYDFTETTDAMTDIGYPVDSLIALARMDKSYRHVFDSSQGWLENIPEWREYDEKFPSLYDYFHEQQAKAKRGVTPGAVVEALELDTFRRSSRIDGKDVLHLMLSVRGEGPDAQATVFSPVIDILKLAVESKAPNAAKDIAQLDKRLVTLSEQHPKSIEAGIAATVFAFLRNDLDSAKDRLKRLETITDYPEAGGTAFWLVARHALKYDETRILGAVLAERALTAAETQPNSRLKEAILRERSGIRTK